MNLRRLPRAARISSRLILFLTLSVVLTALAISVVTTLLGSRDARARVEGQLSSVAALKRQEVAAWVNSLRLNLEIILSETGIENDLHLLTTPEATAELRLAAYSRVRSQFFWAAFRTNLFDEVFFMDREGEVLASTASGHEGQRLGLNDYFIRGLTGEFLEQPSYSSSLGVMTVVASAPVTDQQGLVGVIAGRTDLSDLNQIMIERAGLGDTGETYLVGSNHRLLTYLRRPGFSIPETYIRTAGADAAVDDKTDGAGTYRGYAGEEVIGVYHWLPDLQVALIAEQEEAEALRPTRVVLLVVGGVALLAAGFAVLAGVTLTRRIVRPLADLGTTAGLIAGGRLEVEAPVVRDDEVGALASAFNRMTARLRTLVEGLERHAAHLRALNEAGQQISSSLDLKTLLPQVAGTLVRTYAFEAVHILLLDGEGRGLLHSCNQGQALCESVIPVEPTDPASGCPGSVAAAAERGGEVVVPQESDNTTFSKIAVPVRAKSDLVGVLAFVAADSHPMDDLDLYTARTLADQLAIAVENSRLYQHAHELAAAAERQRLARDLHDAVSQTLFSVGLIAEVLPRLYERNPAQGKARLEELRQLTRGALAEMRTLLLELRPTALAEANLPDLLRQLAEAVTGRARVPVAVTVEGDCEELPAPTTVALYRIAQEALNNVAKHSGAAAAAVRLVCNQDSVSLVVTDDGKGFDPKGPGTGRLGLGIMEERASMVGALLEITSCPGAGTTIQATWRRT